MSSDEEMLDLWKRIAGDTSPRPWTEDNLAGFLQRFRPDGTGVAAAFEGMVGGDEIVPRLMEVYRATETAWDAEDGCDGYFIVRDPAPMSSDHATDLLRLHLGNLAAMSEAVGCDELTALLRSSLVLQAVEGET
ncbi:MAG: hypothetical protein U0790_18370, partial [Isosphaeraceae bacterium]